MKKKILTSCLAVALAAIMLTGATLAYFHDETTVVTNTFTVGEVEIKLDEAEVKYDADNEEYDAQSKRTETGVKYENVIPGMELPKDPTITVTGSESAYIMATVTVSGADLAELVGSAAEGAAYAGLTGFVTGGVTTTDVKYKANGHNNLPAGWLCQSEEGQYYLTQTVSETTYTFTYYFETEQNTGDKIVLFDKLHVDETWDQEQMDEFAKLTIEVKAYAVQGKGVADVYAANEAEFKLGLD